MSLFGAKEKQEIEELKKAKSDLEEQVESLTRSNEDLQSKLLPEHITLDALKKKIAEKRSLLAKTNEMVINAKSQLDDLNEELVTTEEVVMLQSFGLYTPHYEFMKADDYRAKLLEIRAQQKDMVKSKTAVSGSTTWTVNGSESKGKKMVSDMQKLLLRAFNSECDDVVEHVTYSNIESSEKRITSSRDAISKLGDMMHIAITPEYYALKINELHLAFEWQQKKQQEKEAQKEARAEMREAAKLAKELEAARLKLEKEQTHYQNALAKINVQLASASDDDKAAIEAKKEQLEAQLEKIDKEFKDVDYREANQRAGYVYFSVTASRKALKTRCFQGFLHSGQSVFPLVFPLQISRRLCS